ncbi:MAG TPA: alpha/beta hydrolase-fold protein [Bacteroidia bacterium]|nr:alpha/beta hydrolase-fold protein [Bacteroidia bacterium]
MRPSIILTFLICLAAITETKAQNFSIGKYDTLHSNILNEDRQILVHVPSGAQNNDVRYPVMYLLDGENHFTKTVGIIDHLSTTAGNELCPQMIVVAIFHPNREKDLIPPSSKEDKTKDHFPEFLEQELFPYINSHYPTEPYRILVGHSLGGLRVINTMVYQPQLFNSYIALDPSLGMVKNWIGNATTEFNKIDYTGKSLYIAMGMTMPKGMDTAVIFRDTSGNARHMRCIMTFARNAESTINNGLDFNWRYYPDETHQSVVFKGTYDGLIANFPWYKNEKLFDIFKPDVGAEASVRIMTDYYESLSKKMGYSQVAPEQGTSELIDYLTFKRWYDKALAFAQLNFKNYPNSKNAKIQLDASLWNTKKSISELKSTKTANEIYKLCKKEAAKKEPEYNISENAINTLGYEFMQNNKLADAELIFKLNVELYPYSYNVYDSYGECLLAKDQEKEGIAAYRKSLKLNPDNSNARKIIEKYDRNK